MWTISTAARAAEAAHDLDAWAWLISSGNVWRLGSWFQRMAAALMAAGELSEC